MVALGIACAVVPYVVARGWDELFGTQPRTSTSRAFAGIGLTIGVAGLGAATLTAVEAERRTLLAAAEAARRATQAEYHLSPPRTERDTRPEHCGHDVDERDSPNIVDRFSVATRTAYLNGHWDALTAEQKWRAARYMIDCEQLDDARSDRTGRVVVRRTADGFEVVE